MRTELLRLNGAVERDPAIDAWMKEHVGELGAIARRPQSPRLSMSSDGWMFWSTMPDMETRPRLSR
jgi:hypothetical protein